MPPGLITTIVTEHYLEFLALKGVPFLKHRPLGSSTHFTFHFIELLVVTIVSHNIIINCLS